MGERSVTEILQTELWRTVAHMLLLVSPYLALFVLLAWPR